MRKQFLLMLVLCLTASLTWAERIDVATARKVAGSVAQREGVTSGLRSASDLSLVYAAAPGQSGSALRSGTMEGAADYFVFNFPGGKGFAIVSGDDRVRPVLGYSGEGSFDPDNLPENLRGMLAYYQDQITWANDKDIEATPDIAAEWNQLMSGTALRAAGGEVLLQTAIWDQDDPYNRQTPTISGKHTMTGCGATAAAIIMRYHEHPEVVTKGVTSYMYNSVTYPVEYEAYKWDQMPLDYRGGYTEEQADQVAALMWNIGANVKMGYGLAESGGSISNGTDIADALRNVFGYSQSVRYVYKTNYRWADWKKMIRQEIDQKRPMLYRGTGSAGGHLFVLDGYNQEEAFHINWGWSGTANGYYVLTALKPTEYYDFSDDMGMIMGIIPETASYQPFYEMTYLAMSCSPASLEEQTSFTVSAGMQNTGTELIEGYVNMGLVSEDGSIKPISSNQSIKLEVGYGWFDPSDYLTFKCSLLSTLKASDKILPIYSLDGSKWEIMRGAASAPLYIGLNGVVDGKEDDPNDPEPPIVVNISWNRFDDKYMRVSGLDASKDNYDNTEAISYQLSNVREDVVLRYTITNYADWKDHLDIYYGTSYKTLNKGGQGTKVTITDGSFDIPVTKAEIESGNSYYVNYLKIYSNRAGELSYKIQVFPKSATTSDFEQEGKKMTFVNDIEGSYDVNPIRGTVGQMIPFNLTFDKVDAVLQGKPFSLSINIKNVQQGQIHLYGVDGKEIELTSPNGSLGVSTPNPVPVGNLVANSPYSFKLKSDVELQGAQDNVSIYLYTYVNGQKVPSMNYNPYIYIDPATVKTYTVASSGLTGLKWDDGTITSIEEGKEFSGRLVCTQAGYRIPATLQKVTMGGQVLAEGSGYGYADGWINIKKVTGDVVITANAEPIPAVTYMIKASELIGATSDIPEGGLSVKENSECTIKLTAKPGYLIKKTDVIIKTADKTLQQGEDYTCEAADYKSVTVKIHAVTADMELFVYADPEPKSFTITGKLANLTADKDIVKGVPVTENEPFEFTLKSATNYRLPDAITILNGEVPLVAGADKDYTYDKASGKVRISKVTSDLTIKATAIDNHQIQVVFNLEGVIATPDEVGPFTINTTPVFKVAFAAAEGYEYDGKIEVRMGDKLLSTPADYEYVPENDLPFTLKTPLTATLTITAKGTQKSYSVTTAYTNISTPAEELPKNVLHGDALSFKITPDEGYDLPEAIVVKMGGKTLAAATEYTYNKATGEVSIAKVTGDVMITAVAVLKTYEVKQTLEKLTSDFKEGTKVNHGDKLDIQLTATAGYALPESVSVKMNGKDLTSANFSYANGKISIAKVVGPIEISAKANKTYPTYASTENLEIEGLNGSFAEGSTIKAKLCVPEVVEGDYKLPYSIYVTMGDRPLVAGVDYTYNNQTGEIEIPNVHGIVSITAVGIEKDYFEVVLNLSNLSSDPASFEPQAKDTKIELTLKPSSGYELPSGVTVKMGDATLVAGTDYAYDRSTGKFTLEKITGTLVITANGSRIPEPEPEPEPTPTTYTVTLPVVEGAVISASGSTTVTEGSSFSFTVEVKAGYNADNMVVKANGTTLMADSDGRYTIANIRSNVVVTVTGIVKGDDPTANEEIEAGELRVWASGSRLFIRTPEAERAYVVTFDGRVYKTLSLSAGEYSEQMPQGSYIIQIGKQSYKLNF